MMFPNYIIRKPFFKVKQFRLYNPNCIITNPKHVCNMYSHFRDTINLPISYPFVLGHCYLFLVKNRIFGVLDRIALKLLEKTRKSSRTMTPTEGTSYGTPPLKIQNSIVLDPFFIFF